MPKLSKRLQAIADFVPQGAITADIGTDHALLPMALIKTGRCPYVIASDLNKGPYEAARKQLEAEPFGRQIDLRFGDGLNVLNPGEVNCIVIAGMGGEAISTILEARPDVLAPVELLILQPMTDSDKLRVWLVKHGWTVVNEQLIEEDERIYEIIVAQKGRYQTDDLLELEIGPILLARPDPLLEKLLQQRLDRMERAYREMEHSQTPEGKSKRDQVYRRMEEIRRLIRCRLAARSSLT